MTGSSPVRTIRFCSPRRRRSHSDFDRGEDWKPSCDQNSLRDKDPWMAGTAAAQRIPISFVRSCFGKSTAAKTLKRSSTPVLSCSSIPEIPPYSTDRNRGRSRGWCPGGSVRLRPSKPANTSSARNLFMVEKGGWRWCAWISPGTSFATGCADRCARSGSRGRSRNLRSRGV